VLFTFLEVLVSEDGGCGRDCPLDRVPLGFQIVPKDAVRVRVIGTQLHHLLNPGLQAVPLLLGRRLHADRVAAQEPLLAVALFVEASVIGRDFVPPNVERRQVIAHVRKGRIKIRWLLQE